MCLTCAVVRFSRDLLTVRCTRNEASPAFFLAYKVKMRVAHFVGMLVWVSLILALVIHGCNMVKRRHSILSPALLHRKLLLSTNFISMETIVRARLRKRTPSKQIMRARSIARGNAVDDPVGDEIDPRYGVEKRLVPTGPNPLHH